MSSNRVKRPMNAFIIWSQQQRQHDKETQILYISFVEQNRNLGARWKKMTEEEKSPYYKRAETQRIQHKQDHPDYRYRPRPKPKKKSKCPAGTKQSILQNGVSNVSEILHPPPKRLIHE